jgi:NADPH:quinone reductase-like Zn-dependent oxidoreductase
MRIFLAASLKLNEFLVIFGASENTGTIAIQFGKKMGAKVIAVSKDNWIKTDFGADYVISDYDKVSVTIHICEFLYSFLLLKQSHAINLKEFCYS